MVAKDNFDDPKIVNRRAWTADEDEKLSQYIKSHGETRWRLVPSRAGLHRRGRSCRLRWLNYLRPNIKRRNISDQEEDLMIRLHKLLGNRWSLIAGRLPGRTDNEIKNYWNTHLSKKLKLRQHVVKEAADDPNPRDEPNNGMNSEKVDCGVTETDIKESHKSITVEEFNVDEFSRATGSFLNSNVIKPMEEVENKRQTASGHDNITNINPQTNYRWGFCMDQSDDNLLWSPWLTGNLDHADDYWGILFSNNASTAGEKEGGEELDLFLHEK